MRAAVVRSFDQPLSIEDLPIAEPGAGQLLVRIETCGLCHTDNHAARGEWPVKPSSPFIPDLHGSIVGTRHDLEVLDGSAPAPRLVFRMEPAAKASANGHALSAIATS